MMNAKKFGELVKVTRKSTGLTQEQLAAASGVGVRFLRELEQGKPSCQLEKSLRIAQMLGLKFDVQTHKKSIKKEEQVNNVDKREEQLRRPYMQNIGKEEQVDKENKMDAKEAQVEQQNMREEKQVNKENKNEEHVHRSEENKEGQKQEKEEKNQSQKKQDNFSM